MKGKHQRQRFWIPPEKAGPEGLVGVGGDLRPETLIRAYTEGVFPWFNDGDPIMWWSPDPRAVIELDGLHVSRSLARTIRSGKFRVTMNKAFGEVMRACGVRPGEGTWITAEMIAAYERLHQLGHAHSLETWIRENDTDISQTDVYENVKESRKSSTSSESWILAGGIYGIAVGGLFAGESMFHRVSDGSKVALAALVDRLKDCGYELFDVQMRTEHTSRMGATEISRSMYLERLKKAVTKVVRNFP